MIVMPYTYLIKHKPSNTFYYGCRFSKKSDPSDLMVTYFTSSKYVKELILRDGVESFQFEIRKVFVDADSCRKWEHKVLRRLRVTKRDDFINKTDNVSFSFDAIMRGCLGRRPSDLTLKAISENGKRNKGRKHSPEVNKKKGTPGNKHKLGKKESEETRLKKSLAKLGKPSNAIGNYQPVCSCLVCHRQLTSSTLKRHVDFHHKKDL